MTSPSSIGRDRGEKLRHYQRVPSLAAILIIDQHEVCAELHTRTADGWDKIVYTDIGDVIQLPMLNCELSLAQVYHGVATEAQMEVEESEYDNQNNAPHERRRVSGGRAGQRDQA